MGYDAGFAPLCPPCHAFALICLGTIKKKPVVETDGSIVADDVMTTIATGDHRYGDAAVYVPFFKTFIGYIQDPQNFDVASAPEHPHYSELKD